MTSLSSVRFWEAAQEAEASGKARQALAPELEALQAVQAPNDGGSEDSM